MATSNQSGGLRIPSWVINLLSILATLAALSMAGCPLYAQLVTEPQVRIERRQDRLEADNREISERIQNIDRNLATLTGQVSEALKRLDRAK